MSTQIRKSDFYCKYQPEWNIEHSIKINFNHNSTSIFDEICFDDRYCVRKLYK